MANADRSSAAPPNAPADPRDARSRDARPGLGGVLSLVSTPIGNLGDITLRALETLRTSDLIAAEDTRVTRKLLAHFDIHTPLVAYHAHSLEKQTETLLSHLRAGRSIALVSDAGTPGISDPGADLAAAAISAGFRVEPIPGPSALLAALVASGLPSARFVFEGFLPRTRGERAERLRRLARERRTVVLYEAPTRLLDTLRDLGAEAGAERPVVVARELTKRFEEFRRGTLEEVAAHYAANPPRGECVVLLAGAEEGVGETGESAASADPEALLRDALGRGLSPRDAAREVARTTGGSRRDLYARVLRLAAGEGADA